MALKKGMVHRKSSIRQARHGQLFWLLWLGLLSSFPLHAQTSFAVLEFELKDLTLDPYNREEMERTASIKPLFEKTLETRGNYKIVGIERSSQKNADVATGYLFDHADTAAELGKEHGADFIVVGRVHKASFLFVYLMVHLIDTHSGRLAGNYICEVKGPQKKLTVKGVECLVEKIHKTLHPN